MASFSPEENVRKLLSVLRSISSEMAENLEIEYVILYPNVRRKIRKYRLRYYRAYTPEGLLVEPENRGV